MKKRILIATLLSFVFVVSVFADITSDSALEYLKYLFSENYFAAYEMQNSEMRAQFNVDKMKELITNIKAQLGNFEKMYFLRQEEREGYKFNIFRADYKEYALILTVAVESETNKIAGFSFNPVRLIEYVPPKGVDLNKIEEKQVEFGKEPWKLKGSLTVPKDKANYPLVILVHGSGPNDRDETVGPNKPFLDIALGLASKGIAVLRYDKRTYTYKTSIDVKSITVKEEVIDDVISAVEFAKTLPKVTEIYLLGHSLGATLVPEIARSIKVDGIILLAPMVQKLSETMIEQLDYLVSLTPLSEEEKNQYQRTKDLLLKLKNHELDPSEQVLGATANYFYDLDRYDIVKTLSELDIPVLILQGKKDYQITVENNFDVLKQKLSNKSNISFKLYDGLDHLFMYTEGVSKPEDYEKLRNVDPKVIEDIANWVLAK
jgi:hypothetical protein